MHSTVHGGELETGIAKIRRQGRNGKYPSRDMNYIYIEKKSELRSYLNKFKDKGRHVIALDIEAESNLHAYGEKLCLTQIFDGVNGIIIDPFKIDNKTLKLLFESTNILKVMYDAGSDLALLKNTSDIGIKSILDLRPAVELLNYDRKDLHSVIAFELDIKLQMKRKYQQYNWIKRPVSEDAIEYAINDVIYLLSLKDIILAKLYTKKLFEPFFLRNLQIQNRDYTRDPEDKYRKISGYNRLQDKEKTVFRRVFKIREKYAKLYDMPPHNVIHKADLLNIIIDAKYIDKIRFARRLSMKSIQAILHDLRTAIRAV